MSAAAPLDFTELDPADLVLAALGDDTLSARGIWALTGLSHHLLDPTLEQLRAAGRLERVGGQVVAWRLPSAPAPAPRPQRLPAVIVRDRDEHKPTADPDVERADRLLIAACMATGGLPRAVLLPGGRSVWLGPDDRPWRQGVPVEAPR